ncbi:cancer/testis antigen 55-like [Tamandua tetradactyla]|uniref:cancer/testis antigen 55-like n=1 Tax=Tamandua tetradactyla TaxID=48850 RepID=UPI0040539FA3
MFRLIARALNFWRRVDSTEEDSKQQERLLEGDTGLKTVHGVVTRFCCEHGLINESICFNSDAVNGNVLLKVGQKVTALVEEDKTSHGLKAVKVYAFCDNCHGDGSSSSQTRVLIGRVTSMMKGGGYINHTTYFTLGVVCQGFEPYQGDWIEAKVLNHPTTCIRKAVSVKPLRHKHVHEVYITGFYGRNGVIDNTIFFTLDSLKLPDGYIPQVSDVVSAIVVESTQSCYFWRAISITLVGRWK